MIKISVEHLTEEKHGGSPLPRGKVDTVKTNSLNRCRTYAPGESDCLEQKSTSLFYCALYRLCIVEKISTYAKRA